MTGSDARRLCDALSMLGSCQIYILSRKDTGEEEGLAIFPNKHTEIPGLDELVLKQSRQNDSMQQGGETVSTTDSQTKNSEGLDKTLLHDAATIPLSLLNINSVKLPLTLSITPSSVNTKCPTSRSAQQRITSDRTKPFVSGAPVSPTRERAYDEGTDTEVEMVTLKAVTKEEDTFAMPGQQVRYFKDWMSEQSTKGGAEIKRKGKVLCTLCNKFFTTKYLQKHQETMHKVEHPDPLKVESFAKNIQEDENDYILPTVDVENKVEDYTFLSDVENSFVSEEENHKQELAIGGDNKIVATIPKKLVRSPKSKEKRPRAGVSRQQPPKKIKKSLEEHPLQDFIAVEENLSKSLPHSVKESTHQDQEYLETEPVNKKKKSRGSADCDRLKLNKNSIVVDRNIDMKVVGDGDNGSDFNDVLGVGVEAGRVKLSENDLSGKSQDVVGLDTSGAISTCLESPSDSHSIRRSRRLMQNQKKGVVNGSSSKKSPTSNKKKTIQNENSNNSSVLKNLDSSLVSNLTEERNNNTDGGMSITNTRKESTVTFICEEFESDPQRCVDTKMAQNVPETSTAFPTLKEIETEKSNVCEESVNNNLLGHLAFQQNQEEKVIDEQRTETDDSAVEVKSKEILNESYRTTLKPEIEGVKHLFSKTGSLGSAEMLDNVYGLNVGKENERPDETARSLGVAAVDEKTVLKLTPKCIRSSIFEAYTDAEGSSSPQSSVNLYSGTPLPTLSVQHTIPEVINNQPKSQSQVPHVSSCQPPISPARVSFTMKAQGNLIPTGRSKLLFNLSMKPNVPLIKGMLAFKEEIQAGVEELKFECEGKVLTGAELVNEVKGKAVLVSKRDAQSC